MAQVVKEDAIPGLPQIDGVFIDRKNHLYVMATPSRVMNGKPYFNRVSGTLVKFAPGHAKIVSAKKTCPVPLGRRPERQQDLSARWCEGAQWFYGGVGFGGFSGPGCACWWSRFTMDYYARSFVPELAQFSVAVLDSNGNLILRVGRCGNIDDGQPLVAEGGPRKNRSIGGDEVALFHAAFVGTESDRRLFVADLGNACIRSVKLGYHTEKRIALKDVPDGK